MSVVVSQLLAKEIESRSVPTVFAGAPKAETRFWEFFTTQLSNDHTRRAYWNAARRFNDWCQLVGIMELRQVQPTHVAAFLKTVGENHSAPTVKQHLAGVRMLLDWLVLGHVLETNPAHAVRGPKRSVKKGKTPVLTADEARTMLDAIEIDSPIGLRDRALIGLMVYTFARIGAALQMRVEDYYVQGRRGWVRLHEKGGKRHEMPCHHSLDAYLEEYVTQAGLMEDAKGWLFRTAPHRAGGTLTANPLSQSDAYVMIRRRAQAAGIQKRIGNHTFRATGITAYLQNGGKLELAQQMANHESARTTGLYDRRGDAISVSEVERIGI